jgi:cyclopropane fatty-acyl-phospholipid synthase-like methyltransferase
MNNREVKREWFDEWFDSRYYHILYSHRDDREAEVFLNNLCAYLQMKPGSSVLDLPCGKGRHAVFLHQKGFQVEGADLSENSILEAKKMSASGLSFRVHDMRKRYAEATFDYVFNLFTSFGYFDREEENVQAFSTLVSAMAPGATLVIDFMNTSKVVALMKPSETKTIEGITFHLKRVVKDGFIVKEISFTDQGQDYVFTERVKELYSTDFSSYIRRFGLELQAEFGDYTLAPYQSLTSDRYIVIAKKAS